MKPLDEKIIDNLRVKIYADKEEAGEAAAREAAATLSGGGTSLVNWLFSTGASQFPFIEGLSQQTIPWQRVHGYHLDEYKDMAPDHPASFRLWLRERVEKPFQPAGFEYIEGDADDVDAECRRYERLLKDNPIDLGFIGIGENGHIAFNDPPVADFNDPHWVKIVELDETCRKQQLGEGWFDTLDDVPKQAITLTIPAIMASKKILSIVPEGRKAQAVKKCLAGPISTACPASILRTHRDATLFLDRDAAREIMRNP